MIKGFFDARSHHGEQTSTPPTAAATAATQVAPIAQANQAVAPPAPVSTQVAAAEPTAPVAVVAPPTSATPPVRIDAPGISPERLQKALKTVSHWLNLRDQGKYVKAWNDSTFIVTREDWIKGQETIYARRGNVVSRRLEVEQLSPARNPERMLFRYKTYFEKGPWVYEFVYAIPKPNGQWIVTGYFIKMDKDPTALP